MCKEPKYTLYSLLNNYVVKIPRIQRDYAQGRIDKKYIREDFLREIYETVKSDEHQELPLDYVYGYEINDGKSDRRFYPLDGQQRLTTLWLVYWFLAVQSEQLENESETLKQFVYETRKAPSLFCECLCDKLKAKRFKKGESVVDYIENQTWFFAEWKMDPTISSMLRTIEGEGEKDGITGIFFEGCSKNKNQSTWEKYLEAVKTRVFFYLYVIGNDELPLEEADQLYIKMNSRGKALSDFEDFRADLIDCLGKRHIMAGAESMDMLYSMRIDGDWGNLFWNEVKDYCKSLENKTGDEQQDKLNQKAVDDLETKTGRSPDDFFFSFINRYLFGQLCVDKDTSHKDSPDNYVIKANHIALIDAINDPDKEEKLTLTKKEKLSEIRKDPALCNRLMQYDYFMDDESSYESFNYYREILTNERIVSLKKILDGLCKCVGDTSMRTVVQQCLDDVVNSKVIIRLPNFSGYRFFPVYDRKREKFEDSQKNNVYRMTDVKLRRNKGGVYVGQVRSMTYKDRLYFFAICKYLEENYECGYEIGSFKDWLYFCRNVIENAGISSASAMITCMRRLDEYGAKSGSIIDFLVSSETDYEKAKKTLLAGKNKLESQIIEEIIKARAMSGNIASKGNIRDAEDYSVFCGCIRFLFVDYKNETADWNVFLKRLFNIKCIFNKDDNSVKFEFVKEFAQEFTNYEEVEQKLIFHTIGWAERNDSWLDIFSSFSCATQVEDLLMGVSKVSYKDSYKSFVDSAAFGKLVKKNGSEFWSRMEKLWIIRKDGKWACAKKNSEYDMLVFDDDKFHRNAEIHQLIRNGYESESPNVNDDDNPYYWYRDIIIKKDGKSYMYKLDGSIYEYDGIRCVNKTSPSSLK